MSLTFTIGVEEEYQIVDPATRELKARQAQVLPSAREDVGQQVQGELFQSQIEIGTPICETLAEVRAHITRLRRAVIEAAQGDGTCIAAASTHPLSRWQDQAVTRKERYLDMAEDFQQIAREHLIWGCHVHIGIGDREAAIQIMNRARDWLAPLVALTGNSPFWQGEDTGYSSYRTEVWRRWPMAGSPHTFSSRAEYDALVEALVQSGSISDETKIYWDMRPADRFNTLEFRGTDVGMGLDDAVMIAGLARALAAACHREAQSQGSEFVPVRPELLRAAEWRAARYGLDGELVDVRARHAVPARQMIESLLRFVQPVLEERGEWDEISALVEQTLQRGNGASRQRAVFERSGRLEDVVDFIVEETARGVV